MPRAPQTPLGRQLRSVLSNLCRRGGIGVYRPAQDTRIEPLPLSHGEHFHRSPCERHSYHASSTPRFPAAAAAVAVQMRAETDEDDPLARKRPAAAQQLNRRRLNRRTRVSRITETLHATRRPDVAAVATRASNGGHLNFRSRDGRRERQANVKRHRDDFIPTPAQCQEVTLERIVASYIQHKANFAETDQAEWMLPPPILPQDAASLHAKGYTVGHVIHWAGLISASASLEAAQALAECIATRGPQSIPLFVLLYLLRRPYITARALRIIAQQCWTILAHRTTSHPAEYVSEDIVFIIFTRLLRHTREVWPMALGSLPEILLRYLPKVRPNGSDSANDQLRTVTYMLNKAMRLIMVPTAVEPVKDNRFQEIAIVRILSFMAEHNPPLQINREGYRAVTLLQLAKPKTSNDQQWAELKALSWPPWKEDRTAMDADITPEEHGLSKAAETLKRMREAGYGHSEWEKVASIYSGWDTDGTPTIQTLALFGTGTGASDRFSGGAAKWVARITTTRTVQEAWACFLAYEDEKLPPNQGVYLAIFRKLHKEERRKQKGGKSKLQYPNEVRRRIFSGDSQEIEPPPSSVHLHTYTRTSPPTVEELYRKLRERDVVFNGYCLAFLVANARSLELGLEYLRNSMDRYPQLSRLLHPQRSDLTQLPMPIFAAFIELLSRFSNVPFPFTDYSVSGRLHFNPIIPQVLNTRQQYRHNSSHTIVRAVNLLVERRPFFRPAWNSVLKSLAREVTFRNIHSVFIPYNNREPEPTPTEVQGSRGAIIAYRIMRQVLRVMRINHLDLDVVGFHAQCLGVENVAVACWKDLNQLRSSLSMGYEDDLEPYISRLANIINAERKSTPSQQLKIAFRVLVGDNDAAAKSLSSEQHKSERHDFNLPRLLEMPSPAILHSYVRALGWMADYEGLLEAVRWMISNQEELKIRVEKDRNGEAKMRNTLVAIRVFLERSWLPTTMSKNYPKTEDAKVEADGKEKVSKMLRRLEISASAHVIEEARRLIEGIEDWAGWADDEEVERYSMDSRFLQFQ